MIAELDIFGVLVAPIVAYALLAIPVFLVLRWILAPIGVWRFTWHPALFEVSLYMIILSLFVLV
jgi:protein AaeX